MTFNAKLHLAGEVATIRLSGELDARSAAQFNHLVISAAKYKLSKLVLLAGELSYLSSAGLRCLLFAHQKMPRSVRIVLVGTQPEVAETIRLTGFDRSIEMQLAGELG